MYQGINGNVPKFNRTSSQICASPEEELLEAVFNNNLPRIEQLILRNENLLTYTYPGYNKRILLVACSENGIEAGTVEKLLNLRANPRDYTEDDGWEALHWASQKTDFAILNVLLTRNPGDVNTADQYGNNALQILIRHGQRDSPGFLKCVELLIKKGINLNHTDKRNKTALQWADKLGIGDDIRQIIDRSGTYSSQQVINNNLQDEKDDGKQLMNYLNQGKETEFINFKNGNIRELVNYNDGSSTLLQICCKNKLTLAAHHLLQNGADPNLTGVKNPTKPAIIAAEYGCSEILGALLEKYNPISKIPEGLLASIVQYIDRDYHNNAECYRVYMDKIKDADPDEISLKLNEIDNKNNTALHYAIRYGGSEIVEELLSFGASLGAKNKYEVMPIQDMEPEALEKHLDKCVIFDLKSKKIEKEDFQVKFNYRSLIPPYAKSSYNEAFVYKDLEGTGWNSVIEKELVAETEVIFFMSKTSEFKHLLKHPVIVSFLFMKWLRVQWLFWVNLVFYFIFVSSLVVYIFTSYAYFSTAKPPAIQTLFVHISYGCLIITLFMLTCRELFQICVAPRKYFKNFENYIEIILIALTDMIVFIGSPSDDTRKQISSLAILLAAFELVLMLGQHPYFSTNVVMLRTVSFNFFKFLIWYSLLIIAFALSFYLLFTNNTKANDTRMDINNETLDNDAEEDRAFENPGKSVFKTIIMLTGEFDASDLNFDTFPVTSKVIFALFIFMIAIILLNLLNGLAVSDTQIIKNDAELVGHIARAQHIRYVESMLVGNVVPANFMHKLSDICCCLPITRHWNFRICNALARDACLFPKYLNYELTFYPNKHGLIEQASSEERIFKKSCAPCAAICLDRDTIKRTNNIVQAKRDEKTRTDDNQIKKLESELSALQKKVDTLLLFFNAAKTSTE